MPSDGSYKFVHSPDFIVTLQYTNVLPKGPKPSGQRPTRQMLPISKTPKPLDTSTRTIYSAAQAQTIQHREWYHIQASPSRGDGFGFRREQRSRADGRRTVPAVIRSVWGQWCRAGAEHTSGRRRANSNPTARRACRGVFGLGDEERPILCSQSSIGLRDI